MANPLKPIAGNTVGLTAADTKIGTDCKNARVYVVNPSIDDSGVVQFNVLYFWNQNSFDTWKLYTPTSTGQPDVLPWRSEYFAFSSNPDADTSLRKQCYNYLLSIPPFSGAFEQG